MMLDQGFFERKQELADKSAAALQGLSDDVLAHMLTVQLLDRSLDDEDFTFNPDQIKGAKTVLCALMSGEVTVKIGEEKDIAEAVHIETTATELLRRIHGATIHVLGVTMPGIGAEVSRG